MLAERIEEVRVAPRTLSAEDLQRLQWLHGRGFRLAETDLWVGRRRIDPTMPSLLRLVQTSTSGTARSCHERLTHQLAALCQNEG